MACVGTAALSTAVALTCNATMALVASSLGRSAMRLSYARGSTQRWGEVYPTVARPYNGALLLEAARLHANHRRSADLRRRPARSGALRRATARGRPLDPTDPQ